MEHHGPRHHAGRCHRHSHLPHDDGRGYKYILNHSESKYCFVSNEELYNKVMAVKAECPTLVDVFTFEDVKGARHWTEVAKAGSDAQAELEARRDAVILPSSPPSSTPRERRVSPRA